MRLPTRQRYTGFTHHDPLEDTESARPDCADTPGGAGFTHHDPLEDTESYPLTADHLRGRMVSPITIRLRILKVRG